MCNGGWSAHNYFKREYFPMALDQWSSNIVPGGGPNYPRQDLLGEKGSHGLGVGLITQTSWPPFDPPSSVTVPS